MEDDTEAGKRPGDSGEDLGAVKCACCDLGVCVLCRVEVGSGLTLRHGFHWLETRKWREDS